MVGERFGVRFTEIVDPESGSKTCNDRILRIATGSSFSVIPLTGPK